MDLISRQDALDAMNTWDKFGCDPDGKLVRYDDNNHYVPYVHYDDMVYVIRHLPSVQPDRGYVEQIKWERDLAIQQLKDLGYGLGEKARDIDVPTKMEDGTLSITVDMDIAQVGRILLSQKETNYGTLYYPG